MAYVNSKNDFMAPAAALVAMVLAGAFFAGCGGEDPLPPLPGDPGQSGDSSVSGAIGVAGAGPSSSRNGTPLAHHPATASSAPAATAPASRDFVPGEVIVKFRPTVDLQAMARSRGQLRAGAFALEHARAASLPSTAVYRARGATHQDTLEIIRELEKNPGVVYAQPNYISHLTRAPNDPAFQFQWHYQAINLPRAWDTTIGSDRVVVGVVDSGIIFDPSDRNQRHPDFTDKVVPGFDFMSDPQSAGDGDGRDDNPFESTEIGQQTSFHGSHVAGTIAAATDDGVGVAGVDWSAKILPIRALSHLGGSIQDIQEGMMWAAGISIPGVPQNPNPAQVINMSLSGPRQCSPFEQETIDAVLARGVVVVVAAGNENSNASQHSPASCAGVITVGATDFAGQRAPYSNFGSRVDVMAPGGDVTVDRNGDNLPDGILSVQRNPSTGEFSVDFLQGTSMASPHVAGVVALMKSRKSDLTAREAVTILRNTARLLSAAACSRPQATDCGAGLIDAAAAIEALDAGSPPGSGDGTLVFTPNPADFGSDGSEVTITLQNPGNASATWRFTGIASSPDNPAPAPDGALFAPQGADIQGVIPAGGSATTRIGVDRSFATKPGTYAFALVVEVDGAEQRLVLRFSQLPDGVAEPRGPMVVAALIEVATGEYEISGVQESEGFLPSYEFGVQPGENWLIAWSDDNRNDEIDAGDFLGAFPEPIAVAAGDTISGADFDISPVVDVSSLGDSLPSALVEKIGRLD